jgi:hypothetical protein
MIERRSEPRVRSLLGAHISFGNRRRTLDCVVKNIASAGAMVVFPWTTVTPKEFMLHIPSREEVRSARVIWRRDDRAGLALSEVEVNEAPIDLTRRIRRLEAENRRLRHRLDPGSW